MEKGHPQDVKISKHSIYALKYHLPDHVVEYLKKLGTIYFMDASPFEDYNRHVNILYRDTSR